ncbi:MAG: DUF192 domain-containing protein [Candidatus Eremiobacteraeota bacterium]|nr:DUF192 domain-containing protein [Candidatus Eremiobacteraeota bacterium]
MSLGTVIASDVRLALTTWDRAVGFLDRSRLDGETGMWFPDCSAVHTAGMRVRLDIVFLGVRGRVMQLIANAPAWHIYRGGPWVRDTLELPAGTIASSGLRLGDLLGLEDATVRMLWDNNDG